MMMKKKPHYRFPIKRKDLRVLGSDFMGPCIEDGCMRYARFAAKINPDVRQVGEFLLCEQCFPRFFVVVD